MMNIKLPLWQLLFIFVSFNVKQHDSHIKSIFGFRFEAIINEPLELGT
jgi:hypothetical protein